MKAEGALKVLIGIGAILIAAYLWVYGYVTGTKSMQRKAVALGHAEFVADKGGNVEFKWKEACK
jgi:hypothetical protein